MATQTQILEPVSSPGRAPGAAAAGDLLWRLFDLLDRACVPYCVLHGYEEYPWRVGSDVDALIADRVLPGGLASLLRSNRDQLGAEVVQWLDGAAHFITLASRDADGDLCFVHLHACADYDLRRRQLYSGEEVLRDRRPREPFWVPAPEIEFACYLARRIGKADLNEGHARRLGELYRQAAAGCRREAERVWGRDAAGPIRAAAESGDWDGVRRQLRRLGARQARRAGWRRPVRWAANCLSSAVRLARRWLKPDRGLCVVFLGPDGAGKSSVVRAVSRDLAPAFSGSVRRSFPPGLLGRGGGGTQTAPHAAQSRSFLSSALRAVGYWLVYYTLGHFTFVRSELARNALVLYDRHPIDALVDPRRYRYGGPVWLLRLVCKVLPRPDLVILLDAPAEVLQSRKQEVPPEETARQVAAYRGLVTPMPHGHIVDAARPLHEVVAVVEALVLNFLAARAARKFRKFSPKGAV